ncbi:hypothetical protein Hanom_Chr03g00258831 [Helianthus anomalus]
MKRINDGAVEIKIKERGVFGQFGTNVLLRENVIWCNVITYLHLAQTIHTSHHLHIYAPCVL